MRRPAGEAGGVARSFTHDGDNGRCPRCLILKPYCLCAEVPRVEARTPLVVVRHQREGWKSTGTARIAALALPGLRLLEYGDDAEPARAELPALLAPGTHLLFPAEAEAPAVDRAAVTRLVVLDGTWRQVRRMYQRLPVLHGLPRVSLPAKPEPVLRLRESTLEAGRSTLEAIADALRVLEGEAVAAPLHALHARYVEQVFRARGVWGLKRPAATS